MWPVGKVLHVGGVVCGCSHFPVGEGGSCGRGQAPPPREVTFVLRVLVTVMNYGTIGSLKNTIISTAGLCVQSDLVLVAEVKESAVVRVLVWTE